MCMREPEDYSQVACSPCQVTCTLECCHCWPCPTEGRFSGRSPPYQEMCLLEQSLHSIRFVAMCWSNQVTCQHEERLYCLQALCLLSDPQMCPAMYPNVQHLCAHYFVAVSAPSRMKCEHGHHLKE
mmetsp:Transcript_144358/g.251651  ORF Transcript_144358/g.251651 Transcript_144358/m.251651 type:complete len:126 (+) Transcript_144358:588-965(+)